jgi:PIN domain nuclease of toxin-antitoxin system
MQEKNKNIKAKVLLDASAVIALLKKEPGHEKLEELLATSSISAVNLSEVVSVLARSGVGDNEIRLC